jgi:MFS family permease
MTKRTADEVPWRVQGAVYGIGLFSTSMFFMASVIVPLYAPMLDPSPVLLGVAVGARHILPLFLSIHAGALMDRLGARRVMIVFAVLGVAVPLLYPAVPWIWALIFFQMLSGLSDSMGWLGAQIMIGQYMKGRTAYAGRLSFVIRFGHLAAPPMVGAAWDLFGPWGAFGCLALWGFGTLVCAAILPPPPGQDAAATTGRVRLRELLPSPSDYLIALRLLAAPAVVVVVSLGAMMHVGNGVQSSFYVVWLKDAGIPATAIGSLISVGAVGAAIFSLGTARLMRYIPGFWVLLVSLWAGIVLICITPMLGSYAAVLVAMFLRSGTNGLAQPLVITLVLRGAGAENQGKAVGLRATANRTASILSPILMGALAEMAGTEASFYIVGAFATVVMGGFALFLWRRPDVANSGEE